MRAQERCWEFRLDISTAISSLSGLFFDLSPVPNGKIRLKHLSIVVLLLLALVGVCMGRTAKIALLAPLSGPEAPAPSVINQWTELSSAIATNMTAEWQSRDTLVVEVHDTQSSKFLGLSVAASVSADLDIYAVILLGMSTDNAFELARFFRIHDIPCIVSSKVNHQDFEQQRDGPSNFFSIHALTNNIPVALSAFASQFNWTKIALIVDSTYSASLRNATYNGVSVTPINAYSTNLDDVYSEIHRGGFTVIAIASSNVNLTETLINKGDTLYGLFVVGNAWIVFGSPHSYDPKLGLIYVEYVELSETNVALFEDMLSMLPSFEGRIEVDSAHLYDSIHVAARAISTAISNPTRTSVRNAIASIDWMGMTGRVSFAANGFRSFHPLDVWNAETSVNVPQAIDFNLKYTIPETRLVPTSEVMTMTYPGHTDLVPTTDVDIFTVIWLIQPGSYSLPVQNMSEIVHYAAEVTNGQRVATYPTPRMPAGTQLRLHALSIGDREVTLIPVASRLHRYAVLGIISDASSSISVLESALLDPFEIIQLSEAATNPSLSDKTQHPFFIRTVPPDSYQARAILAFCKSNGWDQIAAIHSPLAYGVGLDAQLALEAVRAGVTITNRITLTGEGGSYEEDLERIVNDQPRIILIMADNTVTAQVYKDMKSLGIAPRAIIVSDGGINVLQQPQFYGLTPEDVRGWVGTLPSGGYGSSFELFKREVKSESVADLPGLKDYFESAPNVVVGLIDTVYVYADAMQRLLESGQSPRNATHLFQAMKDTNRLMLTGEMKFDANADRIGDYEMANVVPGDGYQIIGRISPDGKLSLSQPVIWPDGTTTIPIDVDPRPAKWFYWNHPAAIVFSVISALGMLLSILCFVVLVHQKDSSVVRVATWQFLLVMVAGCILGYASVFTWIGRPKPYICALRIWLPPMAVILIMAPLITKTWRLHRIFTLNNFKLNPFPFYYLVIMCCGLGAIQIIICAFWISMGTIRPTIQTDIHDEQHSFLGCGSNVANRVASYVTYSYLGLLMIIGSYVAFRVRNLPKDFNESRWIGFSIYNTLLFSVIILIIGYSLSKLPVTVLILICVCTIAIATGAMCLMVAPKIWILIFYPERRANYIGNPGDTSQSKYSSDTVLRTIPVPSNSSKTDACCS